MNGIAVDTWRNQPNHGEYTLKIYNKLERFIKDMPGATPTDCYNELLKIVGAAKQSIINNPTVHLNNLDF